MTTTEDTRGQQKCVPHGTPTLLRCATCDTPVCPKCGIWTEVGQKCPTCGPHGRGRSRRRRIVSLSLTAAAAIAVVAFVAYLGSDAFQKTDATPPPPVQTKGMGDEAIDQGVAFVVERFECAVQTLEFEGRQDEPNGRFCFLTVRVRNSRSNDAVFSGDEQYLVDAEKRRFDFDLEATILYARPTEEDLEAEDIFIIDELAPGEETQGVLVYDIPDSANIVEAELHGLALDDRGRIFPTARGVRVRLRESVATTTSAPVPPATTPRGTTPATAAEASGD